MSRIPIFIFSAEAAARKQITTFVEARFRISRLGGMVQSDATDREILM
jgi:hypothetical protein